jgi:hypothetical protein
VAPVATAPHVLVVDASHIAKDASKAADDAADDAVVMLVINM